MIKKRQVVDRVIERYFNRDPSQVETAYPLALFARLLDGAIAIGELFETKIDSATTRETELWFLWAALVMAHLKNAGIPVRNPKRRKELLAGPVNVLKKLQSKLPSQRREGDSLRKGALHALKISQGNYIDMMEIILTHWAKGNVATRPPDRKREIGMMIFRARFNEQVMLATNHAADAHSRRGIMIVIREVLSYFGRQGATGMGVSLLVAAVVPLIVPGMGVALRPWLPAMIMIFLVNAFARVDLSHAQRIVARPYKLLCGLGWTVLIVPIVFWLALSLVGRDNLDPGLVLALSLQAAAAPIMAMPAVAMVLELEVTFSVLLLLATMAVQPFTAPFVAPWVAGTLVPIDGFLLGRNLLLMIGGSTVLSVALRRLVGLPRLEKYRFEITGANLIVFTLFGLTMFDGVVLRVFTQPLLLLSLSALAFLIALGSIGAVFVFLRPIGSDSAFMTGFAAGHRNVGLMAAAQSGSLPDLTWLYFALVQLPIYLTPLLLRRTISFQQQKSAITESKPLRPEEQ